MPHSITITGHKYGGSYTYYTRKEAEDLDIHYYRPPFGPLDVPKRGHVLTSNDFVVPILAAVQIGGNRLAYVTPFGKIKFDQWAYMDGRNHVKSISSSWIADTSLDKINMARWHATYGDAAQAFQMAYGYAPPDNLDDIVRDSQYQVILHSEYRKVADENKIPLEFIIQHRQRQTAMMTEVLEHIKEKIVANESLDPSHVDLFERCFKSQQDNIVDMEVGYMREPKVDTSAYEMEATYRARLPQASGGFHMLPSKKAMDDMDDVDPETSLEHPDGFHDITFTSEEGSDNEDTTNQ